MANEIYSFLTLRVSRGQTRFELSCRDEFADMAGSDNITSGYLTVDAAAEAIPVGEAANPKIGAFRIVDAVPGAYIDLSLNPDGSDPFARLRASGDDTKRGLSMAVIPLGTAAIYAKADDAGRKLEYLLAEAA